MNRCENVSLSLKDVAQLKLANAELIAFARQVYQFLNNQGYPEEICSFGDCEFCREMMALYNEYKKLGI